MTRYPRRASASDRRPPPHGTSSTAPPRFTFRFRSSASASRSVCSSDTACNHMSTAMPSKNVSCQFDGISTEISPCRACAARTHVCCLDEKKERET